MNIHRPDRFSHHFENEQERLQLKIDGLASDPAQLGEWCELDTRASDLLDRFLVAAASEGAREDYKLIADELSTHLQTLCEEKARELLVEEAA